MTKQQDTETLYQINVTDELGNVLPIGPRVNVKDSLYPLVEAINLNVHSGKEKNWKEARIETLTLIKQ